MPDQTMIPVQSAEPFKVGMLVHPGPALLDLAGPQAALGMHGETYTVWKSREPITSDSGTTPIPFRTFEDMPRDLDKLFVPGGFTATDVMVDVEVQDFLIEAGKIAQLMLKHDPPPFDTGHPDGAGPEMIAVVHAGMGGAPAKDGAPA